MSAPFGIAQTTTSPRGVYFERAVNSNAVRMTMIAHDGEFLMEGNIAARMLTSAVHDWLREQLDIGDPARAPSHAEYSGPHLLP